MYRGGIGRSSTPVLGPPNRCSATLALLASSDYIEGSMKLLGSLRENAHKA
jgi:hypothetical protein